MILKKKRLKIPSSIFFLIMILGDPTFLVITYKTCSFLVATLGKKKKKRKKRVL